MASFPTVETPRMVTLLIDNLHGVRMQRIAEVDMTFKQIMRYHRKVMGPWVGGISFYKDGERVDPRATPLSLGWEGVVYLEAY